MNPSSHHEPTETLHRSRHANCTTDPSLASLDEALLVHTRHRTHEPSCLQYLAASAYLGGLNRDYE